MATRVFTISIAVILAGCVAVPVQEKYAEKFEQVELWDEQSGFKEHFSQGLSGRPTGVEERPTHRRTRTA